MKSALLSALAVLATTPAFASVYECQVSGATPDEGKSKTLVEFSIDSERDENKFFDLGEGRSAGCLIFRGPTHSLSCAIAAGNVTAIAGVDIGMPSLLLQRNEGSSYLNMNCLLKTK